MKTIDLGWIESPLSRFERFAIVFHDALLSRLFPRKLQFMIGFNLVAGAALKTLARYPNKAQRLEQFYTNVPIVEAPRTAMQVGVMVAHELIREFDLLQCNENEDDDR